MTLPGAVISPLPRHRQKLPCCDIASCWDIANCRHIADCPTVVKSLASPTPSIFRLHVTLSKSTAAAVYRSPPLLLRSAEGMGISWGSVRSLATAQQEAMQKQQEALQQQQYMQQLALQQQEAMQQAAVQQQAMQYSMQLSMQQRPYNASS